MDIKAVIFDYDGTLMDTNTIIINSWQHVAKMLLDGKEFLKEDLTVYFGTPLEDAMEKTAKKYGLSSYSNEYLCNLYRDYQKDHKDEFGTLFTGIKDTIIELKNRGIKLGIVTSRIKKSTIDGLELAGIENYFDYIVAADDTNIHKPDPYPALLAIEKLGVNANEAIMVGDSRFDIECGNRANLNTCFVSWSFCEKADKLSGDACPDFVISKASDLLDIVDRK